MQRRVNQGASPGAAVSAARSTAVVSRTAVGAGAPPVARPAPEPRLTDAAREELHWLASEGSPSLSRHARIVLARSEGKSVSEIAKLLDIDRATVRRWLWRFRGDGLQGLMHASTGKTRKRRFTDPIRDAVARIAMAPPAAVREPFPHWSLRRLRAHILGRGIVQEISVEGLRQLLRGLPLPEECWRRGARPVGPLSADVREGLEALANGSRREVARRARIVLASSRGLSEAEVATALGVGRSCVRRWLRRFDRHGILGLQSVPHSPQPVVFTNEVRAAIVRHALTQLGSPHPGAPGWSLRTLRASLIRHRIVRKISVQHLRRILAAAGISLRAQATPTGNLHVPAHG